MTHGQRTQEQAPGKPLFHKPQEAQAHVNPAARVALLAGATPGLSLPCLLYTSDAADDWLVV